MNRRVIVAILAATNVACTERDGAWTGAIADSAGITIVANPIEGIWTDADRWTLAEELRIGVVQGDPDYQFGRIAGFALGSDNSVYVLDAQARHINVYSREGDYRGTIGGPGGGPGELGPGASFICMGPGDTLLVTDAGNQRINRYAPDWSSAGSIRNTIDKEQAVRQYCAATGAIVEQIRPPLVYGTSPEQWTSTDAIIRVRRGEELDTLLRFKQVETFRGWGPDSEIWLFSPTPVWTVTDDLRLVFGVDNEYQFGFYSAGGMEERIVTKVFPRERVGDRHRGIIMDFLERSWRDRLSPDLLSVRLRGIYFEEYFPAISKIHAGPWQSIWVQRALPSSQLQAWADTARQGPVRELREGRASADWDVFDGEGRYLGIVTMPPGFVPHLFAGEKIYGVWRDELDVQYVVRLGVLRGV